ncbi:hypothetical protein COOONC_22967 [Cooperia oncophora]
MSLKGIAVRGLVDFAEQTYESELLSVLPEKISFDPRTVQIANVPPKTVLNKQNILIMMYSCVPQPSPTTRSFIVAVINANVETLRHLRLSMRAQPTRKPQYVSSTKVQSTWPVDLDFSLTYTQQFERSITGNIVLQL